MPYNGSGVFEPIGTPDYPAVPGQIIKADQYNHALEDFAAGLTNTMTLDGQSTPTADLPMAGRTLTGLRNAVANTEPVAYGQLATFGGRGLAVIGGEAQWQDTTYTGANADLDEVVPGAAAFRSLRAFGSLFFTRQSEPNDMTVTVKPGTFAKRTGGFAVKAAQILVVGAADPTNPRIDIVCLRTDSGSEGTAVLIAGTPAVSPVAPTIPADRMPIAMVTVAAASLTVTDASIVDLRGVPKAPDFTTDSSKVYATGDVMYKFRSTAPSGWLKADAKTIGSAASGATGRANADTLDLYTLIWGETTNVTYVIQDSAGTPTTRGASAANDFAANKRLPLPDLRATVIRGLDDGRGVDAGRAMGTEQDPYPGDHKHFMFNADISLANAPVGAADNVPYKYDDGGTDADYTMQGSATTPTLGRTSYPIGASSGETLVRNTALSAFIKL